MKHEMTNFMIHNCRMDDTISNLIQQLELYVMLEVLTIEPNTLVCNLLMGIHELPSITLQVP